MSDYPQDPNQGQAPPPLPPGDDWSQQPQSQQPQAQQWGGQGGYQGQPQYAPQPQASNGLAIGALVCGILAFLGGIFVLPAILGLVAIVLGFIARGKVKRGEATGQGMALAGIILGALSIIIAIAVVLAGAAFLDFAGSSIVDFAECVEQAGQDQAAIDECGVQLEQDLPGE